VTPVRVLLADNLLMYRIGLTSVLSRVRGVQVVGAVADAQSLLEAARLLRPSACIISASLPGALAAAAAEVIRLLPDVRILVLVTEPAEVGHCRKQGVPMHGHLFRSAKVRDVRALLRQAAVPPTRA
jgi:DNA-binding NarL/FixJ family response regulator